jgi:hypothetical protein
MQVSGSGEYPSPLSMIGHKVAKQTQQAEAQAVMSTLEGAKQSAQPSGGGSNGRGQMVNETA